MIYEDEYGHEHILRVDETTGEILSRYHDVYETRPYASPTTAKEREYLRSTTECPVNARHADEVRDYVKATVDGRVPMVTINNCRRIFDMDSGESRIQMRGYVFTKPQFNTMNRIVKNLTYRNVLIGSVERVAEGLGVAPNKLRATLRKVEHLVHVYTARDGMAVGQVKIVVPPWYGFRYPHSSIGDAYRRCCEEWLREIVKGLDE